MMTTTKDTRASTELGEMIKAARLNKGYKVKDLAEKIGVDHTYITHVEKGRKLVTVDRIIQIALECESPVLLTHHLKLCSDERLKIVTALLQLVKSGKVKDGGRGSFSSKDIESLLALEKEIERNEQELLKIMRSKQKKHLQAAMGAYIKHKLPK